MTFHDREDELAALEREFEADRFGFVVLYGRRRVGKTELIKEFCADRPSIYYLAAQEAETRQREKLVERVADRTGDRVPRIDRWDEAFEYLGDVLSREKIVLAIDEFPYLVESNDSIPSYVQSLVDEHVPGSESLLILCGSSVGVMESEVLGHESPLYGRRTAGIDLEPFDFSAARSVIGYGIEDAIRSYAVTGGTPMYLTAFDYDRSLATNVRERILSKTSVLFNEPEFLLRTELRNPARYMSILEAIAAGHTTPKEIAGATDVDSGPLSKYLRTLGQLRLVDREIPATATEQKSKRSRYRIADDFLRFWFRFVEPNRSGIEQAPETVFDDLITPSMPDHVATTFEDVCREVTWDASETGSVQGRYSRVGRWWYGGEEIDVVGLNPATDRILLGECKWTSDPVGIGVARDLERKSDAVRWHDGSRTAEYVLFSRSGFEDELPAELDDRWSLFDLSDIDDLCSAGR
ncbi:MAG: ATP-binding protein [Halanaeroarchaeum sp.]